MRSAEVTAQTTSATGQWTLRPHTHIGLSGMPLCARRLTTLALFSSRATVTAGAMSNEFAICRWRCAQVHALCSPVAHSFRSYPTTQCLYWCCWLRTAACAVVDLCSTGDSRALRHLLQLRVCYYRSSKVVSTWTLVGWTWFSDVCLSRVF